MTQSFGQMTFFYLLIPHFALYNVNTNNLEDILKISSSHLFIYKSVNLKTHGEILGVTLIK